MLCGVAILIVAGIGLALIILGRFELAEAVAKAHQSATAARSEASKLRASQRNLSSAIAESAAMRREILDLKAESARQAEMLANPAVQWVNQLERDWGVSAGRPRRESPGCSHAMRNLNGAPSPAGRLRPHRHPNHSRTDDSHSWTYAARGRTLLVLVLVHQHPNTTLEWQLQNIEHFVASNVSTRVLLGANNFMWKELKAKRDAGLLRPNVLLNPEHFDKINGAAKGSLLQGIVSNLRYAVRILQPADYMLVLSSRTRIACTIGVPQLEAALDACHPCHDAGHPVNACGCGQVGPSRYSPCASLAITNETMVRHIQPNEWHWPGMQNTMLARFLWSQRAVLRGGAHEGLLLRGSGARRIIDFLDWHTDLERDLYAYGCNPWPDIPHDVPHTTTCTPPGHQNPDMKRYKAVMEEFALQSIGGYVGVAVAGLIQQELLGKGKCVRKVGRTRPGLLENRSSWMPKRA